MRVWVEAAGLRAVVNARNTARQSRISAKARGTVFSAWYCFSSEKTAKRGTGKTV
jgi:hypothetical protein